MNKQHEQELRDGWQELNEGLRDQAHQFKSNQRYERAKWLMENCVNKGDSLSEIARATEGTEFPLNKAGVQQLIDLWAVSKGAMQHSPLRAGSNRLIHAMNQYEPDVSQKEVEE
ncbi:hypothetical protein LCGC14_3151380, partial [marine sediment metagenome]